MPTFTVFDVETTGLDPYKGHKIIEIAGVRVEDGQIREDCTFVELVNPERDVPPEARQVNRIEEAELVGAPTIDQVLPKFLEFIQGSTLVAHNAEFDMGFLQVEKECCWGYVELPECLCTMRMSQRLFSSEFRHNLDALAARLNLTKPENRHRALPDVLLTAHALVKMMAEHNISSLDELREMASIRQLVA